MYGFLVIDKPVGLSSFDVIRRVRRILGERRLGHCGTLDPLASGVLPIALGQATRLVQFVMSGAKSYRTTFQLGVTTDTQDASGMVLNERPVNNFDISTLTATLNRFLGDIEQLPPMYSALKKDGVPLYKLARKGIEVERTKRQITVYSIRLIQIELPQVTIEVDCSKGTYIRTLVNDIGELLGCGAHVTSLRRLSTGPFSLCNSVTLDKLEDSGASCILPPTSGLKGYQSVELTEEGARRLSFGIPPSLSMVSSARLESEEIVLIMRNSALAAIARFDPSHVRELRGDFELICVMPGAFVQFQ